MEGEVNTIQAVIRSIDGTSAMVEVKGGGCGRCHESGGCGGQNLTQMFCNGPKTYRVENRIGAAVGDLVTIAIAEGSIKRTANLAYGVPLLATFAGAVLGSAISDDALAIAGAIVGFALAILYLRFRSLAGSGNSSEHPYIVSRS